MHLIFTSRLLYINKDSTVNSPVESNSNVITTSSPPVAPAMVPGPAEAPTTTAPTGTASVGADADATSAIEGAPLAKADPKAIPAPAVTSGRSPALSGQVVWSAEDAPPSAARKETIIPPPVIVRQASISSVASTPSQSGGEQQPQQQEQQQLPEQQEQHQLQNKATASANTTTDTAKDKPNNAFVPPPPVSAPLPVPASTSTSELTSTSEKDKQSNTIPWTSTTTSAITTASSAVAAPTQPAPNHVSSPTSSADLSQATSMAEALRVVVMRRARLDRQTRQERVEPILAANLALMQASEKYEDNKRSIGKIMEQQKLVSTPDSTLSTPPGERLLTVHGAIRWHLRKGIEDRQTEKQAKAELLKEEYRALNEAWKAHCARLDAAAQAAAANPNDESGVAAATGNATAAAATAAAATNGSGRVTRYSRSTAVLGDAVASDLDFERLLKRLEHSEATDPNILAKRNLAKIPDMISVTHGRLDYVYDDTNNLVTDLSIYEPQTGIDDWTEDEKLIFMERYAASPKQFGLIAEGLPHKTARQCVAFYYLHKKRMIDFRKVIVQFAPRRRGGRRKVVDKPQGGLLADILKHDAEVSAQYGVGLRRRRVPAHAPSPVVTEPRRRRRTATAPQSRDDTSTPEPDSRTKIKRTPVSRTLTANTSMEMEVDSTTPVAVSFLHSQG
jgi:hypothetical protein